VGGSGLSGNSGRRNICVNIFVIHLCESGKSWNSVITVDYYGYSGT